MLSVYDLDGVRLGPLTSATRTEVWYLGSAGQPVQVPPLAFKFLNAWFVSTDCTGQAYVAGTLSAPVPDGTTFSDNVSMYRVPADAATLTPFVQSVRGVGNGPGCHLATSSASFKQADPIPATGTTIR